MRLPAPQHLGPRLPHQFLFSIFQSLWKILKTFQIIENTRNIVNIVLNLRICSVKVSKIQVEREGGVGDWSPNMRAEVCLLGTPLFGTVHRVSVPLPD